GLILEQLVAKNELKGEKARMAGIEKAVYEVASDSKEIGAIQNHIKTLGEHSTNRFLWASQLNEFQQTIVDDIVITRVTMESSFSNAVPVANPPRDRPANPADRARTIETVVMTI